VIVSPLYKVTRRLLSAPAVLLRSEAVKGAELLVLRHENAILRRQLAGPARYKPADRFWSAALVHADNLIHAGKRPTQPKRPKRSRATVAIRVMSSSTA
jgi:hypothetical protein